MKYTSKEILQLKKKYRDADMDILRQYHKHDETLTVNEDRDLREITFPLPSPPRLDKIPGWGLPAKDQKFRPPKLPKRLAAIQKKFATLDEVWAHLNEHQLEYKKEIDFIRTQWFYRIYGYWFYNHGKPVYISPANWLYISWWNIDIGKPKFRDRDRKFFLFVQYAISDNMAYFGFRVHLHDREYIYFATRNQAKDYCKDEKVSLSKIQEGEFFVDMKRRICYGVIYPKMRREGATYKTGCIIFHMTSMSSNKWSGIQSMNETSAKKTFRKAVIKPWKRLPFFFKPNYEGTTDPKNDISFNPPARKLSSRGSYVLSNIGLESVIDFEMSEAGAYDGEKLYIHYHDEVGKLPKALNPWGIHLVVKECLSTGMGSIITGLSMKTSTVGEMTKGGGAQFKELCDLSKWEIRNRNGQTISGCYILFIGSEEGLEGHIDEYGNSILEDPKEPIMGEDGNLITIGARTHIMNERSGYIAEADYEGLAEKIRQYPLTFRECFRGSAKQSGFNLLRIDDQLDKLRFGNDILVRGNFYWVSGRDSRVEFSPNDQGKFYVSMQLPKSQTNGRRNNTSLKAWEPINSHQFVAGGDPFKFNKTEHGRKSNGAGAVFYKHDWAADPNPDPDTWESSHRFVCTYSNRTYDKNEYGEDMLMMCVYYNAKMFPEINVSFLWDYFLDRGYHGYLLYRYDPAKGKYKETPGENTSSDRVKQDIFREFMTHIEKHISKEVHEDLLNQLRDIEDPTEMTHFDLFTAAGYALLAALSVTEKMPQDFSEELDVADVFRTYNQKMRRA